MGALTIILKFLYCFYFCFFIIIFKIYLFIYIFLATLGRRCCTWAFSSCGEGGLLFIVVRRLHTAVASLVAEHGF